MVSVQIKKWQEIGHTYEFYSLRTDCADSRVHFQNGYAKYNTMSIMSPKAEDHPWQTQEGSVRPEALENILKNLHHSQVIL